MGIRYKIWMECNDETIFCNGRKELLENIDELHSLSAAAKKMKMSYRAAWGRLKVAEERLGVKLTSAGGPGRGMCLTKEAKALLSIFDKLQRDTASLFDHYSNYLLLLLRQQGFKIN
jgi:molybdate transport system regulatory protein